MPQRMRLISRVQVTYNKPSQKRYEKREDINKHPQHTVRKVPAFQQCETCVIWRGFSQVVPGKINAQFNVECGVKFATHFKGTLYL
jgi:hypothetical protein